MSMIETLKRQRSPYTLEGRTQELLVDSLAQIEMTNDELTKAIDALVANMRHAKRNIDSQRMRVVPTHLLESVTELIRLSEERALTIDAVLDLCHILGIDSVDLLDEFRGENK